MISSQIVDGWDAKLLQSWRSLHYEDESVQNIFLSIAAHPTIVSRVERVIHELENPPARREWMNDEFGNSIEDFSRQTWIAGVMSSTDELFSIQWAADLASLKANIIEKLAALQKAIQTDEPATVPLVKQLCHMLNLYACPLTASGRNDDWLLPWKSRYDIELRREKLRDILGFVLEAIDNEQVCKRAAAKRESEAQERLFPRVDCAESRPLIVEKAGQYLGLTWMQCDRATDLFLIAMLDSELIPLARESTDPTIRLSRWSLLILCGLAGAIVTGVLLWRSGHSIVAGVVAAIAVYLIVQYWRFLRSVFTTSQLLGSIHRNARLHRNEISSGYYDPQTIKERLKRDENDGLKIPSIVYQLLELRNSPKQ
mgnify:CR=1 FL=1